MDLLELGIAAVRAGNRTEARMYLEALTMSEPDNAQAFLWLSFVLDDRKLAMRCLERVTELDPDNEQARRGLAWLRQQKGDKAAPLPPQLGEAEFNQLVQLLQHPNEQIAVKAIRYLGQAGGARAVEPLMNLLIASKSKTLQAEARTALIAVGTPSIDPAFKRLMTEGDIQVANQLAAVLARVRSMSAVEVCRQVVEQARHPVARYAMALNLTASTHGEAALSVLRDYIQDPKQDPRACAAILGAIGQAIKSKAMDATRGVNFLMDVHGERSLPVSVRQAALMALGDSSQPSVLRYLLTAMGDRDVQMRLAAVDAVGRFTPPQTALLDKLAHSPDKALRARANQLLDQLQGRKR